MVLSDSFGDGMFVVSGIVSTVRGVSGLIIYGHEHQG